MGKSLPGSNRMKTGAALSVLLLFALGWFIWVKYLDANWIEYHYPADGAPNIPLHDTVTIQWKLDEVPDMGLKMEYMDDPSISILGVTSGSKDGMSFMPEGFLPNRKIKVTVTAGWRSYSFIFTTAHEADQGIDLYRSILRSYFQTLPPDPKVDIIALDSRFLHGLKEKEIKQLAEEILAFHPRVLYGSVNQGFHPINETMPGLGEWENPEILLLSLEKVKEELGTHEFELVGKSGTRVLEGKGEKKFDIKYSAVYRSGKWQVAESIGK